MDNPTVVVLIACYNDEEYISKSIESAFKQDYEGPLTICVVDDGSTDRSFEIARNFFTDTKQLSDTYKQQSVLFQDGMGHDGNIKYVVMQKPNGGPSDARNWGIGYTWPHADAYAILDADDEIYENKVSVCIEVIKQDMSMIGVVYGDYDTYHTETKKTIREFKEPYSRRRLVEECIVHSGAVISKKALSDTEEETGFYDKTMRTCEDYDLWMRISEKYVIAHVPESLTRVRITGDNSSFIVNKGVWEQNWAKVRDKLHNRSNV